MIILSIPTKAAGSTALTVMCMAANTEKILRKNCNKKDAVAILDKQLANRAKKNRVWIYCGRISY